MTPREKMMSARTALLLDEPFFGALALRLTLKEDGSQPTAWVDGSTLGYNPKFVAALTGSELKGLIAHEVMHCAMGHPWRRDARQRKSWNMACDYAINDVIVDAGFTLPSGALIDPQYAGKSAEWIYARLPVPPPDGGKGEPGDGGASGKAGAGEKPNSQGEVRDAPLGAEDAEGEQDWAQAVQRSAAAAEARGKMPAHLARLAKDLVRPKVDWRAALRRFVQSAAKADYTWARPSTRYMSRGLYMPSLHSEELGPLAVAIDTSGSIDDTILAQFAAELRAIADEAKPSRISVLYCDAHVHRIDTFERDETITLNPAGGGGTDFRPALSAIAAMEEPPIAVIYLTDMEGSFPSQAPDFPVLWAATKDHDAPFGEKVLLS